MPTLLELQRDMARDMLTPEPGAVSSNIIGGDISAADRLSIYRNTFRSTLVHVLKATYPKVEQVVGADFFGAAASFFIDSHPPHSAYLNAYGDTFADFLVRFPAAKSLGYLPDLARLEWAVSQAANAADAEPLVPAALASLPPDQYGGLRFIPHPSARLVRLECAADEIWRALNEGDEKSLSAVDLSADIRSILVWRLTGGVSVRTLTKAEAHFTEALFSGAPLGTVLSTEGEAEQITLLGFHLAAGLFDTTTLPVPPHLQTEG